MCALRGPRGAGLVPNSPCVSSCTRWCTPRGALGPRVGCGGPSPLHSPSTYRLVWSPVAREPLGFLRPLVKSQGAPSRPPSLECSRERSFDRFTVSLWSHRATGWRPWTLAFTVASVHGAASPGRCSGTVERLGSSESPRRLEELVLLLGRPDAPAGHLKCLLVCR